MDKITLQEFKENAKTKGRGQRALIWCIENNQTEIYQIFDAIENAYKTGRHRSNSYIKYQKKKALILLEHKLIL